MTRYQTDFAERQQKLHNAILHNRLPAGHSSWGEIGANGTNTRVATVYLAEALHRITDLGTLKIYKMIDTVAVFVTFLLLFAYLRQSSPPVYSLVGLLYVAAIFPLTYFFVYFQPWDRVSLVCWIALLILLRLERLIAFTFLLAVSITVKYDTLLLPGLYLLANITWSNWRRIALRSGLMFAVSFGIWIGMRVFLPGGFEERHIVAQLLRNLSDIHSTLFSYPPLLAFLIPMILAFGAVRWADRFSRASVWFGMLLFAPLIFATNFIEIRAEMPILILLLPSALVALRSLCGEEANATTA
jgi:hypothetical protein